MTYTLYRMSNKTNKVDTVLESINLPLMKLWALQNTTKTKQTRIFDDENNLIFSVIGRKESNFPKVIES